MGVGLLKRGEREGLATRGILFSVRQLSAPVHTCSVCDLGGDPAEPACHHLSSGLVLCSQGSPGCWHS